MKILQYYQFTDEDQVILSEFLKDTARMNNLIEDYIETRGVDRDAFWKPYNKVTNGAFLGEDFKAMRAAFISVVKFSEEKYRGTMATLKETMPDHYTAVRQQIHSFVQSMAALYSIFKARAMI